MAYTHKFDGVLHIAERLAEMAPGDVLKIRQQDVAILKRIRIQLYSYLHFTQSKGLYRIKQITPNLIEIIRVKPLEAKIELEKAGAEISEFVLDHLLDTGDEDAAIEIIRGKLPKESWIEAIDEWRRIIGRPKETTIHD